MTSYRVPEILFHDALLAHGRCRQDAAQFLRRRKIRLLDSGDEARCINRQLDALRLLPPVEARNCDAHLFAVRADRVELLEAESDRIDQVVARRAAGTR